MILHRGLPAWRQRLPSSLLNPLKRNPGVLGGSDTMRHMLGQAETVPRDGRTRQRVAKSISALNQWL